jgi:hypothetical protein
LVRVSVPTSGKVINNATRKRKYFGYAIDILIGA